MAYVYLLIAVISEVIATSALNASKGFTVWQPSVVTCIGYLIAIYFLALTMKSIPMGISYALWSGAGIVFISTVGWIVFKQHLDAAAMIGLAFILVGIFIINIFSNSTTV
ncbi:MULTISPECIES: DMT family transporter [Acinetobacter]|jgi:small multidrug resistance pump|uniref:Multidrug efflux SMR transporter n=1 Tax=Acinetobacter terrae TaxID=2731247 RepID=A0A8E4MFC9_9GAMM|nr:MULTISPECIES: multidrug efflux SMR transporter [Acinetobacter]NNH38676.1 multidrug efflux SMR transporter [Acinetobacter terrae]NNH89033.1 multidrug efflux SMR transporter [Acinetobacter terrae]OTG56789.1 QacE family quaternary ammonium compound efflux SMR transporter [Acinetobacter sp. ANC 3903]